MEGGKGVFYTTVRRPLVWKPGCLNRFSFLYSERYCSSVATKPKPAAFWLFFLLLEEENCFNIYF